MTASSLKLRTNTPENRKAVSYQLKAAALAFALVSMGWPAAGQGDVTAERVAGSWVGFAGTLNRENPLVQARMTIEPRQDESLKTPELSRETVQGLSREADTETRNLSRRSLRDQRRAERQRDTAMRRIARAFDTEAVGVPQGLSIALTIRPMYYLAPGFEKTNEGRMLLKSVERRNRRIGGEATLMAAMDRITGRIGLLPGGRWVSEPQNNALPLDRLRLLYDPEQEVIFGYVESASWKDRAGDRPTELDPLNLPALFWREGAEPRETMDLLGEAVNLSSSRPKHALSIRSQAYALDPPTEASDESEQEAAQSGSRRLQTDRRRGRGASANEQAEDRPADDEAVAEAPMLVEMRAEVAELEAAYKKAEAEEQAIRDRRRELSGDERAAATEQWRAASERTKETRNAYNRAASRLRRAERNPSARARAGKERGMPDRSARANVSAGDSDAARSARSSNRSEDEEAKPEFDPGKRPPHDIKIDPAAILAWDDPLAEAAPTLVVDGRVDVGRYLPRVGMNLFDDDLMTRTFGQTLPELSIGDRYAISALLRDAGGRGGRAGFPDMPEELSRSFATQVSTELDDRYPHLLGRYLARERADRYADRIGRRAAALEAGVDTFNHIEAWWEAAEPHLATLWPADRERVKDGLEAARHERGDAVLIAKANEAKELVALDERSAVRMLMSWWQTQGELRAYASAEAQKRAQSIALGKVDELLADDLAELERRLAELDAPGRRAALDGASIYFELQRVAGPAIDRPRAAALADRLAARREADLDAALPALVDRLAMFDTLEEVDGYLNRVLALPSDAETGSAQALIAAGQERAAAINLEKFLARFSQRERELMSSPGRVEVPDEYGPPTAEEIKLAFYREASGFGGKWDPDDPDSILFTERVGKMLNYYIRVRISDEAIHKVKQIEDGLYAAHYEWRWRLAYVGDARKMLEEMPFLAAMYERMFDEAARHTFPGVDELYLSETGWRSRTMRNRVAEGIIESYRSRLQALERALPRYEW